MTTNIHIMMVCYLELEKYILCIYERGEDVSPSYSYTEKLKFHFESCLDNISPSDIGNYATYEWWENCAGRASIACTYCISNKIGDIDIVMKWVTRVNFYKCSNAFKRFI